MICLAQKEALPSPFDLLPTKKLFSRQLLLLLSVAHNSMLHEENRAALCCPSQHMGG